jgi:hypothetical protein
MGSVMVPFLGWLEFLLQTFLGILDIPLTCTGISRWNNYMFAIDKNCHRNQSESV